MCSVEVVYFISIKRAAIKFNKSISRIKLNEGGFVFALKIYNFTSNYTLRNMNAIQSKGEKLFAANEMIIAVCVILAKLSNKRGGDRERTGLGNECAKLFQSIPYFPRNFIFMYQKYFAGQSEITDKNNRTLV